MEGFQNAAEHLLAELSRLDLLLQRQVLWLRSANLITDDEFRGLYVADAQVDALLSGRARMGGAEPYAGSAEPADESGALERLIAYIETVTAENHAQAAAGQAQGIFLPLLDLRERFGLTELEIDVLLLCAAPELDLAYETLYAYVQNDITRKHPTIDLALKLFAPTLEDRLDALDTFAPSAALLRHHLAAVVDDPQDRNATTTGRFLKTDRRMVDYLLGGSAIDARLAGFTHLLHADAANLADDPLADLLLPEAVRATLQAAANLAAQRASRPEGAPNLILALHGPHGAGKRAAVEAICAQLGRPLLAADMSGMVFQAAGGDGENTFPALLDLLAREAELHSAALYLSHCEALLDGDVPAGEDGPRAGASNRLAALTQSLQHIDGLVFMTSDLAEGLPWSPVDGPDDTVRLSERIYRVGFPMPAYPLRLRAWQAALERAGANLNGEVTVLADKFRLTQGQIDAAVAHAGSLAQLRAQQGGGSALTIEDLHAGARAQSGQGLQRLAQKIEPFYTFDDLVLPTRQCQQLKEILTSVRHRALVHSVWGFERKMALGKGLNVLFHGQSGTGKTMAAQIIAGELQLDLYKIDLANVVSKYIGETEKNLDSIFHEAANSNAILQFDEADALLGKRSEVKDAHDRYANIEVAYLLQKMEAYEGIVILTTNMRKNMDEAFVRRMQHTVEFSMPTPDLRLRIWQNIFPQRQSPARALLAPDADLAFLAQQFDFTGASIRNAALAAAFSAAERGSDQIEMIDLVLSTARELQKMGRLPSKASFRQYYDWIRDGVEAAGE